MATPATGGVSWRRFLALAAPATGAALAMVPAIALGWITVGITSAAPIDVRTSGGTSESLTLVAAADGRLTEIATGTGRAAPTVELTDSRLDDLCLVPRLDVPLLGRVSITLATGRTVDVGRITLATSSADAAGLHLPETTLGTSEAPLVLRTSDDASSTQLTDAHLDVYGLELSDGFLLRSLRIGAGGDEVAC